MLLTVEQLEKKFHKKQVLKSISFSCKTGDCIGIVGRNGCGKTTLASILAGILSEDKGRISWDGSELRGSQRSKVIGYVPQNNPLMEELTVQDNLYLWTGIKKSIKLLERYQLDDILNMPVNKLSGGMKRRVAIACAMEQKPSVLVMDEPANALDLYYKQKIHTYMNEYISKEGIIILITHDVEEIQMCNHIYYMESGELIHIDEDDDPVIDIKGRIMKDKI